VRVSTQLAHSSPSRSVSQLQAARLALAQRWRGSCEPLDATGIIARRDESKPSSLPQFRQLMLSKVMSRSHTGQAKASIRAGL
jgi:hypothetical protein